MTVFELARLPRHALIAEYLLARGFRRGLALDPDATREAFVAAILGDPDGGRRVRAMAAAGRRHQARLSELRDRRHAA